MATIIQNHMYEIKIKYSDFESELDLKPNPKNMHEEVKQSLIHKAKKKLGKQKGADFKAKTQFNPYC